ncbi:dUTP diphosphatase [Ancylobacter pratisalsi]|uniref:Deoxyuridine 5'-triphosphate nucleotidohydrolase n=1 Tax=Ancylobacter pratisalsi TaxID=1745854 RepID=A0A6P1YPX9_9HYPH|nr:dUTP diphosphatase [Ancylobacter pratisalsi]QIB33774.1 dUTP diphosphatase [Ancylobacter pratisalsi]
MSLRVPVTVLPHGVGLPLPAHATDGSAGLDLIAALPENEPLTLAPLGRAAVPTGLCIALPEGFEAQIRPRSGLALKQGLTVLNAPGTVDADYRGEVKVLLINLGEAPVTLERGQRIAQMVVAPVTRIKLVEVGDLTKTTRGSGGFGSTGLDGGTISR